MSLFKRYDSKGNLKKNEDMLILLSPSGVLYYGNQMTGDIIWKHETGKRTTYQAFQWEDNTPYGDVGEDGDTLHEYSSDSVSKQVIRCLCKEDFESNIRKTFGKDANCDCVKYDVFHLKRDSGEITKKGDTNAIAIRMTEWRVGFLKKWFVRYLNVSVFCESSGRDISVFHARNDQKFIKLCDRFGIYELPGDGDLTTIVNARRRIRLLERIKIEGKGKIAYFNGRIGKNNVFVKRIPIEDVDLKNKLEEVHTKFNRVESVVKLYLVEEDENFFYLAFEKFDHSFSSFIKKPKELDLDDVKVPESDIIRETVRALQELHSHKYFHYNICPEHILFNFSANGNIVIKFCGMSSSFSPEEGFGGEENYHRTEKYMLGRTFLNFLTRGAHSFKEGEIQPGFTLPFVRKAELDLLNDDLSSKDLVQKLVRETRITLEMVLQHVKFWTPT